MPHLIQHCFNFTYTGKQVISNSTTVSIFDTTKLRASCHTPDLKIMVNNMVVYQLTFQTTIPHIWLSNRQLL